MKAARSCRKIPKWLTSCKDRSIQMYLLRFSLFFFLQKVKPSHINVKVTEKDGEEVIHWSTCGVAFCLPDWVNLWFKEVLSDLSCCTPAGISVEKRSMQHAEGSQRKKGKHTKLPPCWVPLAPATEVWHGGKRWKGGVGEREEQTWDRSMTEIRQRLECLGEAVSLKSESQPQNSCPMTYERLWLNLNGCLTLALRYV